MLGGVLYVVGGGVAPDDEPTATVLAWDPAGRRWTTVTPLPSARARLRLATAGGRLYAIGGGADTAPGGEPTTAVDALAIPAGLVN